jgi:hypothetical protein
MFVAAVVQWHLQGPGTNHLEQNYLVLDLEMVIKVYQVITTVGGSGKSCIFV